MSFGSIVKRIFTGTVTVAADAAPAVDLLEPAIGPLYNICVAAGQMVANKLNGVGVQTAVMMQAITRDLYAYCAAKNLPKPPAALVMKYSAAAAAIVLAIQPKSVTISK
jgi:hypothetical protein